MNYEQWNFANQKSRNPIKLAWSINKMIDLSLMINYVINVIFNKKTRENTQTYNLNLLFSILFKKKKKFESVIGWFSDFANWKKDTFPKSLQFNNFFIIFLIV